MIESIWTGLRLPAGGFQNVMAAPVAPDGKMRTIGPFMAVAHAQPTSLAPGALPPNDDVRPHPHIGIATLSYLFNGTMTHRDTLGAIQVIEPGAVNWMVAGRGVVHSERYEALRRDGGMMHGLQIWIALPEAHEEDEPSFHHFVAAEIPGFEGKGVLGRLLAGAADGLVSPVSVRSPLYLQDVRSMRGWRSLCRKRTKSARCMSFRARWSAAEDRSKPNDHIYTPQRRGGEGPARVACARLRRRPDWQAISVVEFREFRPRPDRGGEGELARGALRPPD